MPAYSERYIAFVDILGFRSIVANFAAQRAKIVPRAFPGPLDVRELLRIVHKPSALDGVLNFEKADFRAQSISDAVAMSAAVNPEGLSQIFSAVRGLALRLLETGILIRGAVTKGRLWHDDEAVFGEGLVRAYDTESKVARYPRVMVTRDVIDDINAFAERELLKRVFKHTTKRADDGPFFLDILEGFTRAEDWLSRAQSIQKVLQSRLNSSADDPPIFEKIIWFSRYWNDSIPGGLGVEGPGLRDNKEPY